MEQSWWWHLWHDPVNSNPWSFAALVTIVAASGAAMWFTAKRRSR